MNENKKNVLLAWKLIAQTGQIASALLSLQNPLLISDKSDEGGLMVWR